MKKKPQKKLPGSKLQEFKLIPITDPAEIAAMERRVREAELRLINAPDINGCQWATGGVSYRQLDKVLRSLGFTCREVKLRDEACV